MNTIFKYAGIGSRKTPMKILALMEAFGGRLAREKIMLRSGGAPGADSAFELGCDRYDGPKEIYIPWNNFKSGDRMRSMDNLSVILPNLDLALVEAERHWRTSHRENVSQWKFLQRPTKLLMARNVHQIMGPDLDDPVDFVLFWTPIPESGGTTFALQIARGMGIPCIRATATVDIALLLRKYGNQGDLI